MRLAAIYIPDNTLPHIFGENHEGETINLGGKNFYSFVEKDSDITLVNIVENKSYISDFYGNNVQLISSIVGQNGTGKSSILRSFNHSIDTLSKQLVYLFEEGNSTEIKIVNETKKEIKSEIECEFEVKENKIFQPLFYSPSLDFDLIDSFSPIALINYFEDDFGQYFLDSVTRNVTLLNDEIINEIKDVYSDFPDYDTITVKVKKHRKSTFRKLHLESNFGNPHRGDVLRNNLDHEIFKIEKEDSNDTTYSFSKNELVNKLKGYIRTLDSQSFTEQFNIIWDLDEYFYQDQSGKDFFHNSNNFIKNLEINILSYLLLNATFNQTGLGSGVDFIEIQNRNSFEEKLDFYLEMYLVNESITVRNELKTKLNGIRLEDSDEIKELIKISNFSVPNDFRIDDIKARMINSVDLINQFYNFYRNVLELYNSKTIVTKEESVIFNIKKKSDKILFDQLVFDYKYLKKCLKPSIKVSLFDFIPNKKLSTGEKAILDFYSSIYNYIDTNKESDHTSNEFYVLLLDEPDLGFHPLWKKKFINAISKTLPILFSKITPHIYDENLNKYVSIRENPLIQIIFTTHDPLTLSDIQNYNTIYLDNTIGKTILKEADKYQKKSFGSNLSDLLADSFFVGDGLIGDFAKNRIQDVIEYINEASKRPEKKWITSPEVAWKFIHQIGEPYLSEKLNDMFLEAFPEYKEDEIRRLEEKLKQLKNDSDSSK